MLTTVDKIKIVLMSIEMCGAIIGNMLLLVLLKRSRKLHRSASLNFIFNCGLSDLTNVMTNIALAMDYSVIKTGNLDGTVMPAFVRFTITFVLLLSFHSTITMMADRYFIVKYPVKYNNMATVRKARIVIALIWLSTFAFSFTMSTTRLIRNPSQENETVIDYFEKQYVGGGKFYVFFVSSVIFTSVAVLSGKLYQVLQALLKKKTDNASMNDAQRLKLQAERRRIASSCRTVLIVMVIYMLSYFPTLLNSILRIVDVQVPHYRDFRAVISVFFLSLSSLCNPIVFMVRSSEIRNSVVGLLALARRRVEPQEASRHNQARLRTGGSQLINIAYV